MHCHIMWNIFTLKGKQICASFTHVVCGIVIKNIQLSCYISAWQRVTIFMSEYIEDPFDSTDLFKMVEWVI